MAQPYNGMTPESVAYGRRYGGALMQQGTDASPVGHWTQALARVLQGGVGGYEVGTADAAERQGKKAVADTWQQGLQRGQPIKAIAASLMGNPWGQEQGQSLASQALQTEASQGFQRSQQDRQFAQQRELASMQHRNAMALRQETDIVRNLRAAGIDPASPEGQGIIRNSIKGGSPIDQAVAQAIQGALPQPMPAQPAQPRLQPQSMTSEPDQPQFIQTQTATPQSQQQAPSMVDTPLGRMPESQAKIIGFGLAMQGKGDAGKMMAGEQGLGKTATNDIDEKIVNGLNVLSRMEGIAQSFKPEYQTIGTRIGMTGAGWMAKIDPSRVDPQTAAQLGDFSTFRRRATENVNTTIKEITGAAMSIPEAQRILSQVPNAGTGILDGDDPITFKAKLDDVIKQTTLAVARQAWLKKNNPQLLDQLARNKMAGVESALPLDRMSDLMNQRKNQIYQELKQRAPNATREQLLPFVGQALKQEFGI